MHSHSDHFMFHLEKESKIPGHYVKVKRNKDNINKGVGGVGGGEYQCPHQTPPPTWHSPWALSTGVLNQGCTGTGIDLNQNWHSKVLTLALVADDGLIIIIILYTKYWMRQPKQGNNWIAFPSGAKTPDLSSAQTRHKHCGALLTEPGVTLDGDVVIWDTLGSTWTECWPTDNTWKQQNWSARKVCRSWRLWQQRVLKKATSSYYVHVWCSVSLTMD